MCEQSKNAFGDPLAFQEKGGMKVIYFPNHYMI